MTRAQVIEMCGVMNTGGRIDTSVADSRCATAAARRLARFSRPLVALGMLLAALGLVLLAGRVVRAEDQWRVMPIRSVEEFNAGLIGGEGEQHPTGIARSVSNPDIIYLAHDCAQFWRSTDNGMSWKKCLGAGVWVANAQSVEVDPVNADLVFGISSASSNYLATSYEGLFRSADGGEHWTQVLRTPAAVQRRYQHSIAYDAASVTATGAQRWYAAFPSNGLYRSEDAGLNWTKVFDLAGQSAVHFIYTHPTDGQTVYMSTNVGLRRSTDRGATFQTLGNLPAGEVSSLALNPLSPATVYAVIKGVGLYRSTDGGATFAILRSFNALRVFLNPAFPNMIYLIGNTTNSLVSANGGSTWNSVLVTPPAGLGRQWKTTIRGDFTGVVPDPRDANKAVAFNQACLWRTEDAGRHWVDSSTLYTGFAADWWAKGMAFDVADPNRFFLFCCDVSIVSTDNGGDWFSRSSSARSLYEQGLLSWSGCYAGDVLPVPGSQTVVASAGMYFDCRLIRSTDAGLNCSVVETAAENYLFVAFHPVEMSRVFAGNRISRDGGLTFLPVAALTQYSASILGMCRNHPDTVYALARPRNRILRSDDRGETWRTYATVSWTFNGLDSKPTFAVDPDNPNKVYTLDATGDLASFDGTTWRSLGVLPLAGGSFLHNFVRLVAIDPRHPNIIYAAMQAAGLPFVFRSVDGGASWENISRNLSQCGSGTIVVHPLTGDVFHGSAYGTWVLPPPYESPNSLYARFNPDLNVSGWEIVAGHGPAGDLALAVADNATEPRRSGLQTLRITFNNRLSAAALTPAAVTVIGQAHGDVSHLVSGLALDATSQVLTVTLSAAPDADLYTITVGSQVKGLNGRALSGDSALVIKALAGDVDGSGQVTAADLLAVRAAVGLPVTAANGRYDVNNSGQVTALDCRELRDSLGARLP